MFISLNKKILYSLFAFMFVLSAIFLVIFISFYSQKLQDNMNSVYMRNQYVVNLLNDNIHLRKAVAEIAESNPQIINEIDYISNSNKMNAAQKELINERKLNEELWQNYSNNKEAMIAGAQIVGISLLVVLLLVLVLFYLLDYWVIRPLQKLIDVSNNVSAGIFADRLPVQKTALLQDEFDILYTTFNQMLDNTEKNIEQTQIRERFLQQLIDAIPDGIRVIDTNYNVVMANRAFYSVLKLNESCVGQKCYKAYGFACDGCPRSRYNCPIKYIQSAQKEFHAIHEVEKRPLYVNADKLSYGSGEEEYYIIEAIHDLSRDVRFSHQQKVSSLAFLSTSLAHEMKNNLGAIRMILEGILDTTYKNLPDDDEQKKYMLMAHKQLVETIQTPERLLKLAQYSEQDISDIDVGSAIRDIMLMIDYDAKRLGIAVETSIEKNLSFAGNESEFKMIILNLAQNAIKAMPDGGTLSVSGRTVGKNAVIILKDSGIGIEAEQIQHIFEPFYSANTKEKSSGLGLAIVSSLVEKASGKISVKSKPNKGTIFTLKFPLKQSVKRRKKS
ncbi:MAG: HAMP domain-containing protein [Alphaproteobacteria bacterium]|nr:HAMP domain-containing protein [Alphaproteobacteria bacterium]